MVKPANLWQLAKNTGTYAELIVYSDLSCHLHDSQGIKSDRFVPKGSLRLSPDLEPVYELIENRTPLHLRPPQSQGTVVARYNGSMPYVVASDQMEFSQGEPITHQGIERILETEYAIMFVN